MYNIIVNYWTILACIEKNLLWFKVSISMHISHTLVVTYYDLQLFIVRSVGTSKTKQASVQVKQKRRYGSIHSLFIEIDGELREGAWRAELAGNTWNSAEQSNTRGRIPDNASQIRDKFAKYFINEGEVSWQYSYTTVEGGYDG